jgi:hypothetical protein
VVLNAQAPDDNKAKLAEEIAVLQKEKEKAELEKAKAEADKARAEAERAAAETRKAIAGLTAPDILAVEAAKCAKDKAEAEKAAAEAEKATLQATLPTSETKPLEGKTTIDDNVVIETYVQAHAAMKTIASRIAKQIKSKAVVYNERDTYLLSHYLALSAQMAQLQARYDTLVPEGAKAAAAVPALLIPMVASAFLRSVADVIALTRADVEIKGKPVTVEEAALVAEIARHAPDKIVYPFLGVPKALADAIGGQQPTKIISALTALTQSRNLADQKLISFDAESDDDKKKDPLKDKVAAIKALNEQTDKLLSQVAVVDEKTGVNDLALLVRAEVLLSDLRLADVDLLFLKVLAAGGNNLTKRTLWSSSYKANGGCVAAYILARPDGTIKASGVEVALVGYATDPELTKRSS